VDKARLNALHVCTEKNIYLLNSKWHKFIYYYWISIIN